MSAWGLAPCMLTICLSGPASVYDGDTWRQNGIPLRLYGVDAIERGTPGWKVPQAALRALVDGQRLACDVPPSGTSTNNGRVVVRCFTEKGEDVSCLLAALLEVRDWPDFSLGAYAPCEEPGPLPARGTTTP